MPNPLRSEQSTRVSGRWSRLPATECRLRPRGGAQKPLQDWARAAQFSAVARAQRRPVAQMVERNGSLGNVKRMAQRQHCRCRTKCNPGCACSNRPEHHHRVGMSERFGIPRAVQRDVAGPYGGKAEPLSRCRELDLLHKVDRRSILAYGQRYSERDMSVAKKSWSRER